MTEFVAHREALSHRRLAGVHLYQVADQAGAQTPETVARPHGETDLAGDGVDDHRGADKTVLACHLTRLGPRVGWVGALNDYRFLELLRDVVVQPYHHGLGAALLALSADRELAAHGEFVTTLAFGAA